MQVLDIVIVLNSKKIFSWKQYFEEMFHLIVLINWEFKCMNSAPLIFRPCHNYEVHFSGPFLIDVAIYGLILK